MYKVPAVIVGAGVVGLAIARELAECGIAPLVVDAAPTFGTVTSSRSSEVVHAGIYYPTGSLKAALCVRGAALLYEFADRFKVQHKQPGKIIFAKTCKQAGILEEIRDRAIAAGVSTLQLLTRTRVQQLEPALDCHSGLLSPATGIVDSHGLMQTLVAQLEERGGTFVARTRVTRLSAQTDGWGVHVEGGEDPILVAEYVVNSAGLGAARLAGATERLPSSKVPEVRYAKGTYFGYDGRLPFTRLIYPVPVPGGLGTHLTFDLAGSARFGPDVEWVDDIDYAVDAAKKPEFVASAQQIWAGVDADRVHPAYAGIRPKLSGPGEPAADFVISGPCVHGLEGLVNLFGIESPGLTASLAIAQTVANCLKGSA